MKVSLSTLRKIAQITSECCGDVQPKIIFKKAAPVVANHKASLIYYLVLLVILLVLLNVVLFIVLKVLAAQPKTLEGPACVLVFEENAEQLSDPIHAEVTGHKAFETCPEKEDCIGSNVSTASRCGSDQSAVEQGSELRAFGGDQLHWQLSSQSSECDQPLPRKSTDRDGYRGKQVQAK